MMYNDQLEERIRARAEMETLKNEIRNKESELRDMASKMSLSDFSTTQLKAELRRRKKEKRGYM